MKKIKLADAIANILKKNHINNIFGLQGGSIVHLFDSFEKKKLKVHYFLHEQTAAFAATAYAKATKKVSCCLVTTGPGSTNTLTGLTAAWQDSVPVIFISGQARAAHTSYGKKIRQFGTQELNILDIVKPITKHTLFIKNVFGLQKKIENAIQIAISGRPGPVWIDLPVNLQWEYIKNFTNIKIIKPKNNLLKLNNSIKKKFTSLLKDSKKPLLVLGYGVRLSNLQNNLYKIIKKKKIPFVSTWNGLDIFPTKDNYNLGVIGIYGAQGANKALHDSDLIICLGTRMAIPHTGTLFKEFSPLSKKIIVNNDKHELNNLNVKFDLKVHAELSQVVNLFKNIKKFKSWNLIRYKNLNWNNQKKGTKPNSKVLVKLITSIPIYSKCIITDGSGNALYTTYQCSDVKKRDRIICSAAVSSMGAGLAETIGAGLSKKFKKIICIIGDGSIAMNIQDLQTIRDYNINCLILLINNNGYKAIRDSQKVFLNKKYYGAHPEWKLKLPNFEKISAAFGIKYFKIKNSFTSINKLKNLLDYKKPLICEVFVDEDENILFKQNFGYNKKLKKFEPLPLNNMSLG